jgi:uncharacterized protein
MEKMENPFVYGKEVSGKNFCNRKNEIQELYRDIVNSQNVIIFSQRRFGKTSLIKKVFEKCKKDKIITIYVDLYPMLSEEDFISIYARAITKEVVGNIKSRIKDAANLFKRIKPSFTLDSTGKVVYRFDVSPMDVVTSLEDVLESVNRAAISKKKKIAVCFDEFQQIGVFKIDKLEKMMRSSFQSHKNVSYIFMGSKKHLIFDIFNNPNRPFYRSAKPFPLEKMGKKELFKFIKQRFFLINKDIEDDLIDKIIDMCESHPYYVQYLCHIVWEKSVSTGNINYDILDESMNLLLNRESSAYEATWSLLTTRQKQVLIALSKSMPDEKLFSAQFLQKHRIGVASTVQRTLKSLVEKDIVDKEKDEYSIIDVFFKKWLAQLKN